MGVCYGTKSQSVHNRSTSIKNNVVKQITSLVRHKFELLSNHNNKNVSAPCSKTCGHTDSQQLNLAFTTPLLTEQERESVLASSGELGDDPSSQYFVKRNKSIAYVAKLHGEWFQINKNYFIQHAAYNDFSGGYKRTYQTMPSQFIECRAVQKMLDEFQRTFQIPDNELLLVQVQCSHIETVHAKDTKHTQSVIQHVEMSEIEEDEVMQHDINPDGDIEADPASVYEEKSVALKRIPTPSVIGLANKHQMSITGQGIHTDGHDYGMLVCLERRNIDGAQNSVYYDLEGDRVLMEPFVLQEGTAMFWRDNQVYHYVNPARLVDRNESGSRTVLIAHYPAIHSLRGIENPNNTLRRNRVDTDRQLRNRIDIEQ